MIKNILLSRLNERISIRIIRTGDDVLLEIHNKRRFIANWHSILTTKCSLISIHFASTAMYKCINLL